MKLKIKTLKLENVNEAISNNIKETISFAESEYRGQLFELASKIYKKKDCKIVLLAGGSCAGKTTTARLLKEILEKMGKDVKTVSLDNFFKNRADTPVLPNGNKDYDSLNALLLDELEKCFGDLFTTGEAKFPDYNFLTGINTKNVHHITCDKNTIIIFEGLHTINPEICKRLCTKGFMRVYIGPINAIKYDRYVMSPEDLRLVRRTVRDLKRRGYSILHTVKTWPDVLEGEDKYIKPYTKKVDFIINTTHCYEIGLYKDLFLEEYESHKKDLPELEFIEIIKNAKGFNKTLVPTTSLMWEFVDQKDMK